MRLHIMSYLHQEHSTFEMPETKSDVLVLAGDILASGHKAIAWAACEKVNLRQPVVQVAGNHEFYGQKFQAERGMMTLIASLASSGNQVSTLLWKDFVCQNVTCIIKLIYFRRQYPKKKTIPRCSCPALFLQLTFDMEDQLPPQLTA